MVNTNSLSPLHGGRLVSLTIDRGYHQQFGHLIYAQARKFSPIFPSIHLLIIFPSFISSIFSIIFMLMLFKNLAFLKTPSSINIHWIELKLNKIKWILASKIFSKFCVIKLFSALMLKLLRIFHAIKTRSTICAQKFVVKFFHNDQDRQRYHSLLCRLSKCYCFSLWSRLRNFLRIEGNF